MPKYFVDSNQITENKINIIGQDVKHIKTVLRLKINDEITVCNKEEQTNYIAEIKEINIDNIICNIVNRKVNEHSEPDTYIHLFQGLPKFDKMEYIIEKCTEIGISEITPLQMTRCVVKLDEKKSTDKLIRWQKISEVAAKQSGRDIIPKINRIIKFKNIFEKLNNYDIVLVAYENESQIKLKEVFNKLKMKKNLKIAVIIGPEGGIDKSEIETLIEKDVISISLGPRILRTETASLVLASNILYELEG